MNPTTLNGATLEKLISAAVAAPSFRGSRPWRYRLDPDTGTFQVRAVPAPGVPEPEAAARALHVSVGAAVFNLRVALAHFGWEPAVQLLPVPGDPDLLASVRPIGPRHVGDSPYRDLYDAIWRRHSCRTPYFAHCPTGAVVLELIDAAHAEGASLTLPRTEETLRLLRLTAEAEQRGETDVGRAAGSGGRVHEDSGAGAAASLDPGRRPLVAVLTTPDDSCADWLRAGQAMERVVLLATAHTVHATLLHEAMEWPDLRAAMRTTDYGPGLVQMLIRFGAAATGDCAPRVPVRGSVERG
ncbi:nitroreductase family protein [Actinacidiphila glaucinigra]|uniref:Nitroreductase domain-containing protein n=1 Tax=Actinacidiphila glaucinigra TaxID=235986 RepID=A0A239BKT5_9ACTN|nr:hypothetical protein [Actinacidiphila glaucinigra]SNS08199.1 hypothetical protein SAMN05216252_1039 [Actinacidiphila glaucinigra]